MWATTDMACIVLSTIIPVLILINEFDKLNVKKTIIYSIILILLVQYLFINANPTKDFTLNKLKILNFIPNEYKPYGELYNNKKIYKFPFILKPLNCSGDSKGVQIIKNKKMMNDYLNKVDVKNIMYQELSPYKQECTILYERSPLEDKGKIVNIYERKYDGEILPHGVILPAERIDKTLELEKVIDMISRKIPDFFCGRYDIRFDNIDDLKKGKKFHIVEANGSLGYDIKAEQGLSDNMLYMFWPQNIFVVYGWAFRRIRYGLENVLLFNNLGYESMIQGYKNAYKCKRTTRILSLLEN